MNEYQKAELRRTAMLKKPAPLCIEAITAMGLTAEDLVFDGEYVYIETDQGWMVSGNSADAMALIGVVAH